MERVLQQLSEDLLLSAASPVASQAAPAAIQAARRCPPQSSGCRSATLLFSHGNLEDVVALRAALPVAPGGGVQGVFSQSPFFCHGFSWFILPPWPQALGGDLAQV